MGNVLVRNQLSDVKDFLAVTSLKLEEYLNGKTIPQLLEEQEGDDKYYKLILSNLRRLLVFSEEGLETCSVILQSEPFQKATAEKTLYRIYHQCIEEFFSPKNDAWYENSRSAYTGKNSIKFYKTIPESVQQLIKGLEGEFQRIREELEFYETDYRTKMIQSK